MQVHENTRYPRSGGQKAKFSTAVHDQVEFDVSTAAEELPAELVVGIGMGRRKGRPADWI